MINILEIPLHSRRNKMTDGKKQIGMWVEHGIWERAKASGFKFPYIFEMGLDTAALRLERNHLLKQMGEQDQESKKRADAILFLQSELLSKNDEIQALKQEIEEYKYPLSNKAKNK